jgi:hypothetical protein
MLRCGSEANESDVNSVEFMPIVAELTLAPARIYYLSSTDMGDTSHFYILSRSNIIQDFIDRDKY